MIKRLKTSLGMVAGLAALSLGGAAIAGAATGTAHPAVKHAKHHATREATQTRDTDQVQSGDQTTPDTGGATSAEAPSTETTSGESAAGNDGPGGHADEPGNPNANTQQQGQN
ncbi:MAG: hypothetical protein M3Y09_07285 [Actinomycetota bacterium]|nr:hypothetical protein [Actinomycetota bacterium]